MIFFFVFQLRFLFYYYFSFVTMEAFLTTLPPYVHAFLNKHPPTDVFNLLRELICFAVLYSEDRERINQATHELLEKRNEQVRCTI
ncbi:hypothetical protein BD560DRAFT_402044 [Blakeslea trispora]|nr:hypothetical protein BD560DRAFT_402044 [Blakeslea trispora]